MKKIIGLALFQLLVLTSCKEEDLGASPQKIQTVAGKTGNVVLVSSDITGLGSAAGLNVGTSANNLVQLDGTGKVPTSLLPAGVASVTMSGDVTSSSDTSIISKLKGVLISISSLTANDVLQYNGTNWVNAQLSYQQYAGEIMAFAGSTCPTGWLLADGTVEANATEPQLFAAIGCNWGCPNGVSFNRPDLRGVMLRGRTSGSGRDPDVGGRTAITTGGNTGDAVGSYQDDAFQGHDHSGGFQGGFGSYGAVSSGGATGGDSGNAGFQLRTTNILNNGSYGTARVSTETRSKNVYVLYCVRRNNR